MTPSTGDWRERSTSSIVLTLVSKYSMKNASPTPTTRPMMMPRAMLSGLFGGNARFESKHDAVHPVRDFLVQVRHGALGFENFDVFGSKFFFHRQQLLLGHVELLQKGAELGIRDRGLDNLSQFFIAICLLQIL